jgi:tRNA threonylcarbamoyladenosine biosynthesis protein TsaE
VRLDEQALVAWGERIGRSVARPAFFALSGELGAGKSVLARAIARGAGVSGPMPSPTFNLLFRYRGDDGATVSHLDLYRVRDVNEVWELGWDELGEADEIVIVEWAERAAPLLPARRWDITLSPARGAQGELSATHREVQVRPHGGAPPLPEPPQSAAESPV